MTDSLDELSNLNDALGEMLDDPQPGNARWVEQAKSTVRRMWEVMDGLDMPLKVFKETR